MTTISASTSYPLYTVTTGISSSAAATAASNSSATTAQSQSATNVTLSEAARAALVVLPRERILFALTDIHLTEVAQPIAGRVPDHAYFRHAGIHPDSHLRHRLLPRLLAAAMLPDGGEGDVQVG